MFFYFTFLCFFFRRFIRFFFNFLPLFAVIPFGIILMVENYSTATAVSWMALMYVFTLTINYLNFIIESKSADTELSFLPIIVIASVLFGINYFEIVSLSGLLASGVTAITENPLLLSVPILLLIGLYYFNYSILRKKLYLDASLKAKTQEASTNNLEWTRRFGAIAPFLQLDLKTTSCLVATGKISRVHSLSCRFTKTRSTLRLAAKA